MTYNNQIESLLKRNYHINFYNINIKGMHLNAADISNLLDYINVIDNLEDEEYEEDDDESAQEENESAQAIEDDESAQEAVSYTHLTLPTTPYV